MKKTFLITITIFIIIFVVLLSRYYIYKEKYYEIKQYNSEYEAYINNDIYGYEIASIINKAIDNNEINDIEKDENGIYIQNDVNSMNVEVKITDLTDNIIYTMETLYNGGISRFVQYYDNILFKSTIVRYNSNGRICYILFEQVKD